MINPGMGRPPLQYKLRNRHYHACTPKWLLQLLRNGHASLHEPCRSCSSADGLHTRWSSTEINFVNPPFSSASRWLPKPAEEAKEHKHSLVLVPFRPHTKYMWQALHHAASVCVLTQPIRFETEDGNSFARPLQTPVCRVSFDPDLALRPRHSVSSVSLVRFYPCEASVSNVLEKVRTYTGSGCECIPSPIRSYALHDASRTQDSCAAICPARVTNVKVKVLLSVAHHVAFISPPLIETQACKEKCRCVEGSLIAFFTSPFVVLHDTNACTIRFSMLNTTNCTTSFECSKCRMSTQ